MKKNIIMNFIFTNQKHAFIIGFLIVQHAYFEINHQIVKWKLLYLRIFINFKFKVYF